MLTGLALFAAIGAAAIRIITEEPGQLRKVGPAWQIEQIAIDSDGVADLLDHVMDVLPEFSTIEGLERSGGPRRIALIGRNGVPVDEAITMITDAIRDRVQV